MDISYILDDLNEVQRDAVTEELPYSLVLAGAGSAARGLSMPLLINSNKIFTLKLPHQGTICWLRYTLDIIWLSSYIF